MVKDAPTTVAVPAAADMLEPLVVVRVVTVTRLDVIERHERVGDTVTITKMVANTVVVVPHDLLVTACEDAFGDGNVGDAAGLVWRHTFAAETVVQVEIGGDTKVRGHGGFLFCAAPDRIGW